MHDCQRAFHSSAGGALLLHYLRELSHAGAGSAWAYGVPCTANCTCYAACCGRARLSRDVACMHPAVVHVSGTPSQDVNRFALKRVRVAQGLEGCWVLAFLHSLATPMHDKAGR